MENFNRLFVKISYRAKDNYMDTKMESTKLEYKDEFDSKKYIVCGGFYSRKSGAIIFRVDNIEDAKELVKKAYITGKNAYRYELEYKLLAV